MKKIIKKAICFICAILFFQSGSIPTYADESAAFYVQTAVALSDGMIRVSVYMKDTDNLAGVDAELFFDSAKVSFEGSSLGKAFSSSYADINYDKDNSKVHYVMLYPDGVSGDGIMMTVDFKLLGTDKSYQPELKINSLIDSSNEMNEIPYSIKYQQADGNWSDNTDQSGNIADKKIIADTLKEYGSKEDKKTEGKPSKDTVSVDSNNNLNGSTAEWDSVWIGKKYALRTDGTVWDITDVPKMLLDLGQSVVEPGDVDGDSKVSTKDLMIVLYVVSGRNTLTADQSLAADIDGDGKVTVSDLTRILYYVSGRNTTL